MTLSEIPFLWHRNRLHRRAGEVASALPRKHTLAQVKPGRKAKILQFLTGMKGNRQAQMQAYGLTPGFVVRIVQHNPVTIVQIEHFEMAIETELAEQILVEEVTE